MPEPGFRCCWLPVARRDRPTPLQVAYDRAVAVITPQRECVNADDAQRLAWRPSTLLLRTACQLIGDQKLTVWSAIS